jgi:quinol monooxygenase YgiN
VVLSVINLFPAPKHRAEMLEILRSVQDFAYPSPGCTGCWISEEEFADSHVRYSEQWESDEALATHLRSDLYRRVLAAMELSRRPPEVHFYYCDESRGFEVIEAARGQDNHR